MTCLTVGGMPTVADATLVEAIGRTLGMLADSIVTDAEAGAGRAHSGDISVVAPRPTVGWDWTFPYSYVR